MNGGKTDPAAAQATCTGAGTVETGLSPELAALGYSAVLLDRERRILAVNRATEILTGQPAEALCGRKCHEVFHRAEDPPEVCPFQHAWESRRTETVEMVENVLGGTFLFSCTPLYDDEGKVNRFLHLAVDITEQKDAEKRDREREQLAEREQHLEGLSVLASGIAHDFNNLLMVILGNSEFALMDMPVASAARESVQVIQKEARKAAQLCKYLLSYAGKGKFVSSVNLSEIIWDMEHLLRVLTCKRCVIEYDLRPDLPRIEGDAAQLRQVVMDVVSNVARGLEGGKQKLSVVTGRMTCDAAYLGDRYLGEHLEPGDYVYLDIGFGRPVDRPARAKRAFSSPFLPAGALPDELDITTTLRIIHEHGGALKVFTNTSGRGIYKIIFPVSGATRADAQPAGIEVTDAGWKESGTVLLVDDDDSLRRVAKRMLESMGIEVLTAADGWEAVDVFRNHADRIDATLLDLTMPGLSGRDVFREIRKIRGDAQVLLTSGYSGQEVISTFEGDRPAGFIQKPYEMEALQEALRAALATGRNA